MHGLNRSFRKRHVCIGMLLGLVTGSGLFWYLQSVPEDPPRIAVPALPSISDTPYRNVTSEARFVGRQTCAECHTDLDHAYQQTGHAQAFGPIDISQEPTPAEFSTDSGQRRYRIFHHQDQLWHQESLKTTDREERILSSYPMRWVIGSGRFSKSYLAEVDGFLIQSPATWYHSRPGWWLSPGYERYNSGFERTTELRCLHCHVGRVEPKEGSFHRLTIHTQAIDCERCHGPGSLHVAERSAGAVPGREDLTIVHPGRLDRKRSEAICAQCHWHGGAMVDLRGRQLSEFRPGLALTDFAIPYGLKSPRQAMQVVGHVEQMHLSRCYQASDSLTCITCHNPHRQPEPSQLVAHYRQTCLTCHEETTCGIEVAQRREAHADDNCIACHMPKSPTEIPHFAFTHHRIGIHSPDAGNEADTRRQTLVPLADVSHLSSWDRDRNLGLAYVQVADQPEHVQHAEFYHDQARRILTDVRNRGFSDPAIDAALARLYWSLDSEHTVLFAQSVLDSSSASPEDRSTALFTLATTYFQQGRTQAAAPLFEELVRIRRYADAWHALSLCRENDGDWNGAIEASAKAAEISPLRPEFQQRLIELYHKTKRPDQARKHRQQLDQLTSYLKSRS